MSTPHGLPGEVPGGSPVVTRDPCVRLILGGAITADFLYNSARPVAPGTPFFLFPGPIGGFNQDTFDAHARQTTLAGLISLPLVCGWEAGGVVVANLYNDAVILDRYGLLPIQAYGQLKNEEWRFAATSPGWVPHLLGEAVGGRAPGKGNRRGGNLPA